MRRRDRRSVQGLAGRLAFSTLRLPWSLGWWGVRQATGLADPNRSLEQTARELEDLSRAAAAPLSGHMRDLHQAGEHLQAGSVDSAVRLASGSWREPRAALDEAWQTLARTWDSAFCGDNSGGDNSGRDTSGRDSSGRHGGGSA